jgi:hypothetical protein
MSGAKLATLPVPARVTADMKTLEETSIQEPKVRRIGGEAGETSSQRNKV